MNKIEYTILIWGYIPVIVWNVYWMLRYKELYWDVLFFRDGDNLHSIVSWFYIFFPVLAVLLFRVVS